MDYHVKTSSRWCLTWNFTPENYHVDNLSPGNYVYTFDVSTGTTDVSTGSTTALTKSFTVTVTLIDPCITPTVTQPTTGPQTYTITNVAGTYAMDPKFTVTPSFFSNSISYSATGLESYLTTWAEGS